VLFRETSVSGIIIQSGQTYQSLAGTVYLEPRYRAVDGYTFNSAGQSLGAGSSDMVSIVELGLSVRPNNGYY
jgi:hypothetical protein